MKALPLVNLTLLQPFATELRARRIDPAPVFESVGLTEQATFNSQLSVHAMVVTQFVENAAEAADDLYFAAQVGSKLDLSGWKILADAEVRAKTVVDFLSIFIGRANEISQSATEYLRIEGKKTTFGETRTFEPSIVPAQNDAFMASLAVAILRKAMNQHLDPSQIDLFVSEPQVLPQGFDRMHPMGGDRMGFRLLFPTAWLSTPFNAGHAQVGQPTAAEPAAAGFVDSFRQLLRTHVGEGSLTAEDCARLASMSQHKLKRKLAAHGTDTSTELDFIRQEYAREALRNSRQSVAEISSALGYTDPANFARAFKRAHGFSPSAFRTAQSD